MTAAERWQAWRWLVAASLLMLASCSTVPERDHGPPPGAVNISKIPDAVPRVEPLSRYGNPPFYDVDGHRYYTLKSARGYHQRGIASWYGTKFDGRRTSSGEPYNMYAMTAAHKTLPLPSYVQVTNLENGRHVVVRVNDRGPFHANRLIDLSYAAARKLGIWRNGTGLVDVRGIDPTQPVATRPPPAPAEKSVQIYLQAGAFAVRGNADRLVRRLHGLVGGGVRVTQFTTNGVTIYRVRVGPLANVDEADRLTTLLVGRGFEVPQIVLE